MLERGLVGWLVTTYLAPSSTPTKLYGLEYGTALLMNLCLHQSGKQQCVPLASSVLDTLVHLMARDLKQINPYVNGALYSLLGNKEIHTVAKQMGIENKIVDKCGVSVSE